ncbi:MAG: hypothetical protein N2249_02625 [Melioribacter sp.]|nr:hypothetical protein [Melioribacter sp.]
MIRLLIWIILFFLLYTIIKIVKSAWASLKQEESKTRKNNSKYIIKEEDIIEAKFEDINPKVKNNSKN